MFASIPFFSCLVVPSRGRRAAPFIPFSTAAAATQTGNRDAGEEAEKLLFAVKKQIKGARNPRQISRVCYSHLLKHTNLFVSIFFMRPST